MAKTAGHLALLSGTRSDSDVRRLAKCCTSPTNDFHFFIENVPRLGFDGQFLERFWLSSKQPQRLIQLKFGCNVAMDQAGADRRDRMSPLRARAPARIARRRHQ